MRHKELFTDQRSHGNQSSEESNDLITTIPMVAVLGLLVAISVSIRRPSIAGNAAAIITNAYFQRPKAPKSTTTTVGKSTQKLPLMIELGG